MDNKTSEAQKTYLEAQLIARGLSKKTPKLKHLKAMQEHIYQLDKKILRLQIENGEPTN